MCIRETILSKLGAACHLHRKLAESAARAADAVGYLEEQGVLKGALKDPPGAPGDKAATPEKSYSRYRVFDTGLSGAALGQLAAGTVAFPLGKALLKNMERRRDLTDPELSQVRNHMSVPASVPVKRIPILRFNYGPHYDSDTRTVHTNNPNSYSTAHEFGHASGPLASKKNPLRRPYTLGYLMGASPLPGLVAGLNAANRYLLRETGEEEGIGSKVLSGLDLASKAGTGVMLAEEGQATARALRAIYKVQGKAGLLRAAKLLAPAYGTYVATALGNHVLAPAMTNALFKYDLVSPVE